MCLTLHGQCFQHVLGFFKMLENFPELSCAKLKCTCNRVEGKGGAVSLYKATHF